MNPDPFEHHLQRRALPELPPQWRAEILGAAAAARDEQERTETPAARRISWKHVRWGALAAVWVGIVTFNQLDPAETKTSAPTLAYKDVLRAVQARTKLTTEARVTDQATDTATRPAFRQRSGHFRARSTVKSQFA